VTVLPFGKYRGQPIRDVPAGYLAWLLEEVDLRPELAEAVRAELSTRLRLTVRVEYIAAPMRPPQLLVPAIREIVRAGYRDVARRVHPDVGGNAVAMRDVNVARDWLVDALCGGRA
jgi:hypothetical protein